MEAARITAVALFISSLLTTLAPLFILRLRSKSHLFSFVQLFGSGSLLYAASNKVILHVVPKENHNGNCCLNSFSIELFISGITFMILYFVDLFIVHHPHCDEDKHTNHSKDEICCADGIKYTTSKLQALFFVLSISLHSFFEGLAVKNGKLETSLIVGLFIHKIVESLSLGIAMFSANLDNFTFIFLATVYSVLTPAGMIFTTLKEISPNISRICNATTHGAIYFIVFVETLPAAFHDSKNRKGKFWSFCSGYVLPAILDWGQMASKGGHSHGGHSHGVASHKDE